jgi:hypothetical protein
MNTFSSTILPFKPILAEMILGEPFFPIVYENSALLPRWLSLLK